MLVTVLQLDVVPLITTIQMVQPVPNPPHRLPIRQQLL